VDETYVKVAGQWQYLYRAIDSDGTLVDVFLNVTRDQAAAEAFFRSAITVPGIVPETVTTDKHAGYPPALEEVFGDNAEHHTSKYKQPFGARSPRGERPRAADARLQIAHQRRPVLPGSR